MMLEKKRTTFISILTCKVHPENTEKQPFEVYEANHGFFSGAPWPVTSRIWLKPSEAGKVRGIRRGLC